jgi:hypothetical protein
MEGFQRGNPTTLYGTKVRILATIVSVAPIVDTLVTVGKLVFKAVHSRKEKKQHIDEETQREERRLVTTVQRSRPEIYGELQLGLRMAGTHFVRGDGKCPKL